MVLEAACAIQSEDCDAAARLQETAEAGQGGPERKVVQGGDDRNEFKAGFGEGVTHDIALNKADAAARHAGSPGACDRVVIGIYADDLLAMLSEPIGEKACAASHIEGSPAVRRNSANHEIVIVNVVIPRRPHRSYCALQSLGFGVSERKTPFL